MGLRGRIELETLLRERFVRAHRDRQILGGSAALVLDSVAGNNEVDLAFDGAGKRREGGDTYGLGKGR